MYKPWIFFGLIIVLSFISTSNATYFQRVTPPNLTIDLCLPCVTLANESINVLLVLIVDPQVLSTCGSLCGALENRTKSEFIGDVCLLACDTVGITEFIKLIRRADLDPIWYCELAQCCPINDHGNAKFTNLTLTPSSGPKGTTFTIDFSIVSSNGTGTGELVLDIRCPDRVPTGKTFLFEAKKPGTYHEQISFKADRDPSCDPTEQPCEAWIPGLYNITLEICNGECGSKHPHSTVYDTSRIPFQITN